MSWSSSLFVGVLTGIVGLIVGSLVAGLAASWYRVPSFEAQSAAFVISVAILSGFVGFLIGVFKGERVPVGQYTYYYPVRIDGAIINVAYGETGHYVSLSVPDSVKATKLLDAVAKRLDVELATGKYDSLLGR